MKSQWPAARSVPAPPPAEKRIGRYLVLGELGAGGMGVVYRARDEGSGRIVALKQLRLQQAGDWREKYEALFEREYHTLVRLKHPRIIEVFDYGLDDTGPYYAMELLEGSDLQQVAPLPYKVACRHLRDVASSLTLLHAHRLVHRDVSPRNVRLTPDGRAKLIDFGVLAGFGPANHLVGTAPCVAPESVRYMPLDHRTDLYALGAVAYVCLTGRHAYPARRIEDLPDLWQKLPPRPSELVPEIPEALDSLVMGLLSVDPLARPASGAAVIDQLTIIGELEPEDQSRAAESYLLSSRMVGRNAEQEWAVRRIIRAIGGKGGALVLEGPAGVGKTRLLHELSLSAQLKGMLVLKADASSTPDPFGVAIALGNHLLAAAPALAERLAQPQAAVLGHLLPQLTRGERRVALSELASDMAERRLQLQSALHNWLLSVAREQPLMLAVDNVQAADDNSTTLLAALGQEARRARLMVLATIRRGDTPAAAVPLRLLRQRSGQLKLGAISRAACDDLVKSLFGDVPNCGRLAKRLFDLSLGNPQHCIDLAQLLVRKEIVRYAGGMWVLPLEIGAGELPSRAQDIAAMKLSALSPEAHRLAESLSVHDRPLSLEHCLALCEVTDEKQAYSLLDQLVAEQILAQDEGSYRFVQDQVRAAVLAQTEPARRIALHRRAADALMAGKPSLDQQVEGAFHLLRAGERERGADIMALAARKFLRTHEGVSGNVNKVVQALVAALEVYEKTRSKYEVAELLFTLISFAWFVDWRLIAQHSERAIDLGLDITGLRDAEKLSRRLGPKLGLALGLLAAELRMRPHRKRGLNYDVKQAISFLCSSVPASAGVPAIALDTEASIRIRRKLSPLQLLRGNLLVESLYAFAVQDELSVTGRERETIELIETNKRRMQDPSIGRNVGSGHWKALYGGQLYAEAIQRAQCFGSRALELAGELEQLKIITWTAAADQVRLLYHACRGESEEAAHYRERVELYATQGGTTWQTDLLWPTLMFTPDMLAGDTIAVRRSAEQLERLSEQVPSLRFYAQAARAAHYCLRGEFDKAIALYERLLPQMQPQSRTHWLITRAYFAQALNGAGQHARAKQLLRETLAHCPAADYVVVLYHLEPQRQLALAEAGLGNFHAATALLDRLLAAHGHEDNALLVGLLHKARAEVAAQMGDGEAFKQHLEAVEQRFRSTRNPALIASLQHLVERASRRGVAGVVSPSLTSFSQSGFTQPNSGSVLRTLQELSMASDRYEYAVKMIVEKVGARAAYLYLYEHGEMRLCASSHRHEPPADIEAQLLLEAQRAGVTEASVADVQTQFEPGPSAPARPDMSSLWPAEPSAPPAEAADSVLDVLEIDDEVSHVQPLGAGSEYNTVFRPTDPPPSAAEGNYRVFLLRLPKPEGASVVGGVIVDMASKGAARIEHQLLEGIAKAISDSGTPTSIS